VVKVSQECVEQHVEGLRLEFHERCQAIMTRLASIEQNRFRLDMKTPEEGNSGADHKTGMTASPDEQFEMEYLSQERQMRESQFGEVWLHLTHQKATWEQLQHDIEGRLTASHTSVEECLEYLEKDLSDTKLQVAERCDELSVRVASHQERFQTLEENQQHHAAETTSGLNSMRGQLQCLVREAVDAAILQMEISGTPSVFKSLPKPEHETRNSQAHDVAAHLDGVVKHLETHKSSMEAQQRQIQEALAREQAAREAFEQALRERIATDREAQQRQMRPEQSSGSFTSPDETAKHDGKTEVLAREIQDLLLVERASREEGHARYQERLTWERVERERHTANLEDMLTNQEAFTERRHLQTVDRLDALNESVGIFDGIISAERKERTAEIRRMWDALDSHTHSWSADLVLPRNTHKKSEADAPRCSVVEPIQSMQATRTKPPLQSPRLVHASSAAVLQQFPQGVGTARRVVRQSSTPSLVIPATPRSPRMHVMPVGRPSSTSAFGINGRCLPGGVGDTSLGGSLCGPACSPGGRGLLRGHAAHRQDSQQSTDPRVD